MGFHRAVPAAEVPPGQTKFLVLRGLPLLLANANGRIYALHGLCPHRGNPLEGATICDHLLDCPWHHFQYDVRTGENHYPANVYPRSMPQLQTQLGPLKVYRTSIRDGAVWVDIEKG